MSISIARKLLNLTFFPLNELECEYYEIKNDLKCKGLFNEYETIFKYFEHTYFPIISTNENTNRYTPVFWSCYDRIINDIPRSTNAVEGWHRAINNSTTISHPNLARFIIILKI
ncbi:hypothetical protein DMUE_1192 [Dictyocoela muelleri]|nr:hypothetical protein DMUE_1192 [Dictyocoela muelleri]